MKAFTAVAHIAHQYRHLTLPGIEWSLLDSNVRNWNQDVRPLPDVERVPYFESGKYDFAILLFDQQCIDYSLGKGKLFQDLVQVIDCPLIVVVNGTPFWAEKWDSGYPDSYTYPESIVTEDSRERYRTEYIKARAKELIGDAYVIVNSQEAADQWGFGHPIIHGIPETDYFDLIKEPRAITCTVPAGLDYHYGRELLHDTQQGLSLYYGERLMNIGDDWSLDNDPKLADYGGWSAYKHFLGSSLIYFNPTRQSPMPRARTEAMLSGCCILTTPYHGADKFINCDLRKAWTGDVTQFIQVVEQLIDENSDTINGFVVPEAPQASAALIHLLIHKRYRDAVKIGQNGKQTARKLFSWDRYSKEILEVIKSVANVI